MRSSPLQPVGENKNAYEGDILSVEKILVYEDSEFLAVDKPAGVPTVGGAKNEQSVVKMLKEYNGGQEVYLLHRLAREISGVLLVARSKGIASISMRLIQNRQFWQRCYWAVTCGRPLGGRRCGTVRMPLCTKAEHGIVLPRSLKNGGEDACSLWAVLGYWDPHQDHRISTATKTYNQRLIDEYSNKNQRFTHGSSSCLAATDTKVMKKRLITNGDQTLHEPNGRQCLSLLEMRCLTGRRHQVRAHCAFGLGCPILGDGTYSGLAKQWTLLANQGREAPADGMATARSEIDGKKNPSVERLQLHSREIRLHKFSGEEELVIRAPPPPHMQHLLAWAGLGGLAGKHNGSRTGRDRLRE